ncbi:MAG: hypothetical protein CM15mP122_3350 [Bacteroidota bacterium]|nr:MAG: hypothetical protein CM15mP122_3350 [Bacteroidota bacterium]
MLVTCCNNQGSYDETFDPTIIGDANPDWIANLSNSNII